MPINHTRHQSALRKWRVSSAGSIYSITTCVNDASYPLITDPYRPQADDPIPLVVMTTLKWLHDNNRIQCHGFTIMPDHVHFIFTLLDGQKLSDVMRSFGSFTSREINRLLNRTGQYWQKGYYDRQIRNQDRFVNQLQYIYENPIRKGYVTSSDVWPFSDIFPEW